MGMLRIKVGDEWRGVAGIEGPQGETGAGLEYNWSGTSLGVRIEGDASYTYTNLEGPTGPQGPKGDQGVVSATSPIIYNASTQNISINDSGNTLGGSATGVNSISVGSTASSEADRSVAIGNWAQANTASTIALGEQAEAGHATLVGDGVHAIAIGAFSRSPYDDSIAMGQSAETNNYNNVAIGRASKATGGMSALAMGHLANASGEDSVALGQGAIASGLAGASLGSWTQATGDASTAIGAGATATANEGVLGNNESWGTNKWRVPGSLTVEGDFQPTGAGWSSIEIGNNAEANFAHAIAIGLNTRARADSAIALGDGSTADGSYSIAIGVGAFSNNQYSYAIGQGTVATGYKSLALGDGANASTDNEGVLGGTESWDINKWRVPGNFTVEGELHTTTPTIATHAATKGYVDDEINAIELTADDIPNLDAAKITSGTFAAARIPALDYLPISGGTITGSIIVNSSGRIVSEGMITLASPNYREHLTFQRGTHAKIELTPSNNDLRILINNEIAMYLTNGACRIEGDVTVAGTLYGVNAGMVGAAPASHDHDLELSQLNNNAFTSSAPPSSYPSGMSMMAVSGSWDTSLTTATGFVVTIRNTPGNFVRAYQEFTNASMIFRRYSTSNTIWGDWRRVD